MGTRHLIAASSVLFGATLAYAQTAPAQNETVAPQRQQADTQQRRPFGAEATTTIHIRLLNGKTGQPIADKEIFLERNKQHLMSHAEEHEIKTDTNGLAEATVADKGEILNPIVVDYKSCTPRTKSSIDTDKAERFSIAQILSTGVVAQNRCGKTTEPPTPGQLTLYFRTMNVLERITD
ncbi:hypothetical protein [Terriglobus aquaticus]|uniref:Uncharacterized protein n=1 Tax=Terriglobus aquaticus TaxID=940139 RepID=A0ABW9KM54_9BACT|nr:hypothetical protein [Terriglobus aquaticus]